MCCAVLYSIVPILHGWMDRLMIREDVDERIAVKLYCVYCDLCVYVFIPFFFEECDNYISLLCFVPVDSTAWPCDVHRSSNA